MAKAHEDTGVVEKERTKNKKPRNFKVIIHNDDYTPVDFVIAILMRIFDKTESESFKIAHETHNTGKSVAGIYTKEVAETKSAKVNSFAKIKKYPLQTTIEPE